MNDIVVNTALRENGSICLDTIELSLHLTNQGESFLITCISHTKKIRAIEFMDFLFDSCGVEDGDEVEAHGRITKILLELKSEERGLHQPAEYFEERIREYYRDTVVIDSVRNQIPVETFPVYQKKKVHFAVVNTLDIAKPGELLRVRSLENRAGSVVVAHENTFIMIGNLGEVYEIKREKLEHSYDMTEKQLDIFAEMMNFLPVVERSDTGEVVMIDELAKICIPKQDAKIAATKLVSRTKVFGKYNSSEYFLGRAGDYLAVRLDDLQDMYIIKNEIFQKTYEIVG